MDYAITFSPPIDLESLSRPTRITGAGPNLL